jgi:hypothetical protein
MAVEIKTNPQRFSSQHNKQKFLSLANGQEEVYFEKVLRTVRSIILELPKPKPHQGAVQAPMVPDPHIDAHH